MRITSITLYLGEFGFDFRVRLVFIKHESPVNYHQGNQYVIKETPNAETSLAFEFVDRERLAFYSYVRNNSGETIVVEPRDFFFTNSVVKIESEEDKNLLGDFNVIDPEEEILRIDEDLENVEDQKDFFTALNCLFIGAEIIGEIASSDEEKSWQEVAEDEERRASIQDGFNEVHASLDDTEMGLHASKSHWREETLRRTTLSPGEDIGGLIYLPLNLVGEQFSVSLVVGNTLHRYKYIKVIKN